MIKGEKEVNGWKEVYRGALSVCLCFGEEGEGSNTMRNTCLRNILRRVGQQSNATYSSSKPVSVLKIPSGRVFNKLFCKSL